MANLVAAREALDRFQADLPAAGPAPDALRRAAQSTRVMVEHALSVPDADTAWIDHNLAALAGEALADPATRAAGDGLYFATRRRLAAALERDPDDLAHAWALALGAARAPHDDAAAADIPRVAAALERPGAGPRLVRAAVALVLAAARAPRKHPKPAAAAREAAPAVRRAAQALRARLPRHPDLDLDLARLELLAARQAEGEERAALLGRTGALLDDHVARFGPSAAARRVRGDLLTLAARGASAPADIRKQAVALFEEEARERTLRPDGAGRLVRAMERAGGLDPDTAAHLAELVERLAGDDATPWRGVLASLLPKTGQDAALVDLWERALAEHPDDGDAARGLAERLVKNLRAGLAPPFSAETLDRVLTALPYAAMARWSAADVDAVLATAREQLSVAQAAQFARDRLLHTRDLRGRAALWDRALKLYEELGDEEGLIKAARLATKHANHPGARLLLVERMIARGEGLDEAETLLRPLLDAKGAQGKRAQELRRKLANDPAVRGARRDALLAFERQVGVGTPAPVKLRVAFVSRAYALVDAVEHRAPDFYAHKHLRVMVRPGDLPPGVEPSDLRKGDLLSAPVVGEDGDPARDKDALRLYWVADPKALTIEGGVEALRARWAKEEQLFGVESGAPIPLKVRYDGRRKALQVRVLGPKGRGEFAARPVAEPSQLPAGLAPEQLGKGRRLWGVVVRAGEHPRSYRVVGELLARDPGTKASEREAQGDAPASTEEAPTPPTNPAGVAPTAQSGAEEAPASAPTTDAPQPASAGAEGASESPADAPAAEAQAGGQEASA